MAVDAYSGIGEDTGPAHLDDLLAVGVDVADQSLLHGHAHVPVLDDVGASVSGSLSPDTEHAAFLRDVTEGLTEEIGGDVQQQDVVKGQTAALAMPWSSSYISGRCSWKKRRFWFTKA